MTVGIVGLGLIGGSAAKAYAAAGWTVCGLDRDKTVFGIACLAGDVSCELTEETAAQLDLLLLAVPPRAAIDFLQQWAPVIPKGALVIDFCGNKREICRVGFALAGQYGFTFAGGHPMAGSHHSGYAHSRANLFANASFVLVPPVRDDMAILDRAKRALAPLGLGRITVASAQEHDRKIAFTSQLAHVVSNAYVKSETAQGHVGFSAGSYRDLTRVAWLAPEMWTELFLENQDNLLDEIDTLICELGRYRAALAAGDGTGLCRLLQEGRDRKEAVDGCRP